MIIGIHHAQITIPCGTDKQAREFYCDVLGLIEIEKPDSLKGRGGFWLQTGNLPIHVGTEDGFDRLTTKAHLAYEVTDIKAWRNRMKQHEIEAIEGVPIPGFDRFEIRDPFGNRLEFIQAIL